MADNARRGRISRLTVPFVPPNTTGWPTCPACQGQYERMEPGGSCYHCTAAERRRGSDIASLHRESGIAPRHAKYKAWSDLKGALPYLEAVYAFRDLLAATDSVVGLIGNRGTGKSQAASVAVYLSNDSGRAARIIRAVELYADQKGRFGGDDKHNAELDWIQEWTAPRLLCIDEIAELHQDTYARSRLTSLVDSRYLQLRPTVIIGNLTVETWPACVGASIADRANEGGGLIEFKGWSFR